MGLRSSLSHSSGFGRNWKVRTFAFCPENPKHLSSFLRISHGFPFVCHSSRILSSSGCTHGCPGYRFSVGCPIGVTPPAYSLIVYQVLSPVLLSSGWLIQGGYYGEDYRCPEELRESRRSKGELYPLDNASHSSREETHQQMPLCLQIPAHSDIIVC